MLLVQLIHQLRDGARDGKFKLASPIARNLAHIALLTEELILSSHQKVIDDDVDVFQSASELQSPVFGDVNEPILSWVQKDYLLYLGAQGARSGSSGSPRLTWAEWDLVEALLTQLSSIFPVCLYG